MLKISRYYKNKMMQNLATLKSLLSIKLIMIALIPLLMMPTPSYCLIKKIDSNTATIEEEDLRILMKEISINKAKADTLQEALSAERSAFAAFESQISQLMAAHEDERKELLKALEDKNNKPYFELYTGYNTKNQWEGGVRFIIKLK